MIPLQVKSLKGRIIISNVAFTQLWLTIVVNVVGEGGGQYYVVVKYSLPVSEIKDLVNAHIGCRAPKDDAPGQNVCTLLYITY